MAAALTILSASAQLKQFTLEDLNFGGTNYRNLIPENQWHAFWGDELMRLDTEQVYIYNKVKGTESLLFSLDDVNKWISASQQNDKKVRRLSSAEFPDPSKPWALLDCSSTEQVIIDWQKQCVVRFVKNDGVLERNDKSGMAAVLKADNLFVTTPDGEEIQLTTDGSREIVYGQSVHRNEFGIMKGTFFSPCGTKLAFYRMDQSMVTDYPQVDLFQRVAGHAPDKYPMAGMTSHKVTVGIFDLATRKTLYLDAGDPTDRYFTNIAWSPDSKTIFMFELNRDQNDCRLVSYDAQTGARIAELYRETSDKYVEPLNPIQFLPWDNSKFIMQSQKDGYNHLYLYSLASDRKSARQLRQLTSGQWVVMEVVGFCPQRKSVVIQSNEASPIQQNIYEVNVANGKRTLLDNGRGWHTAMLSNSGAWIRDTYQEPDVPRVITLTQTAKPKAVRTLLTAKDPWADYAVPEYRCGTIKAADGVTDLYYRMVMPVGFDETKQYPTVVYVYGGPHAHNVDARWHYCSRSWETYMAQKGYLLFILDNRGSEHRGRDFEQVTFRHLGQEEMKDQVCGVDYLRSLPYVDADRIGVHGWSYGGFMTISLMTNYPEIFKVGVAGGPVIDWKWYEVMYGERYMDTPETNPEGYAETSLLNKAANLKGRLQIITGMNDNTVVPQHCLMFLNACSEAGTQPDFYAYPGEEHNMRGHKSVHLHERITRYFEDYLK